MLQPQDVILIYCTFNTLGSQNIYPTISKPTKKELIMLQLYWHVMS